MQTIAKITVNFFVLLLFLAPSTLSSMSSENLSKKFFLHYLSQEEYDTYKQKYDLKSILPRYEIPEVPNFPEENFDHDDIIKYFLNSYRMIFYPNKTPVRKNTHVIIDGKIDECGDEYIDLDANCQIAQTSFTELIEEALDNRRLPIIAATDVYDNTTKKIKRSYFDGSSLYSWLFQPNSFARHKSKLHPTFKQEIQNVTFFTTSTKDDGLVYIGNEKTLQDNSDASFLIKFNIIAGSDCSALFNYGYYLYGNKLYDHAEQAWKFAAEKYKHSDSANNVGTLYFKQHKLNLAEKYYLFSLNIEANQSTAYNLGNLYFKQKKFELAAQYYLLAADQHSTAYYNLGFIYYKQNKFDLAEKYYLLMLDKNPLHHAAANNLGIIYYKQNKFDLAEKYYLSALEKNSLEAAGNLGNLYKQQNKLDLAYHYYKLAQKQIKGGL